MRASAHFIEQVQDCIHEVSTTGVDALGALFDLTSHRLVRFAVAVARNQHDAEDAVQTVLVRVTRQPQLLAPASCPWAYLLRMVRNEAVVIMRRRKRCSSRPDLTDLVTYCPVDEAEHEETHRAVWAALRALPPRQAEVVVLKIWEGMTFAQIGAVLELSPNTVASRYQYAMEKLSRRLWKQHREVRHE